MQTDLFLIRHGQTATNQARVIQGWDSEPLNARGRWQAERAGQRLAATGLAGLYTSPLRRASETAEIIGRAARLDVVVIDDLREMNTGRVSGLHSAQFMVRHPRLWWAWLRDDAHLAFPGGDTLSTFYERAAGAIGSLVEQNAGQAVAVVAHGGVISGYLTLLTAGRGSNRLALRLRNGAISHVRWTDGAPAQLLELNDTRHLREQTPLNHRPSKR